MKGFGTHLSSKRSQNLFNSTNEPYGFQEEMLHANESQTNAEE